MAIEHLRMEEALFLYETDEYYFTIKYVLFEYTKTMQFYFIITEGVRI